MRKRDIEIGDRYVKVEDPRTVWVVNKIVDVPTPLPHVLLHQEERPTRRRTLAVNVLHDKGFYVKLEGDPTETPR